jgi:hypothetical protein
VALSNAERQAAYRTRKREAAREQPDPPIARLRARILDLEEEVRHLKAELAKRPVAPVLQRGSFNSQPFTPVPKVRPRPSP